MIPDIVMSRMMEQHYTPSFFSAFLDDIAGLCFLNCSVCNQNFNKFVV